MTKLLKCVDFDLGIVYTYTKNKYLFSGFRTQMVK